MAKLWIVLILVIMPIVNRAGDDISCHYKTEGDALLSVEDASFSPPSDSIFFHETSCSGMLNSRKACAIESAANAHPRRKVYLLFSGPINENMLHFTRSNLFELKNYYPNINFKRVHVNNYAKNTALEELVINRTYNKSQWQVIHISDLLRFLTMYKFGGVYLDTDVIVVKPLDDLGQNWVVRERDNQVGNAVLNAAKDVLGQDFMGKVLEEISSSYNPDIWDFNGPGALIRVLSKFCNTSSIKDFSKANCQGFEVYNPELIYPVPYDNSKVLLEPGYLHNEDKLYTVHIWNSLTNGMKVEWDSPFDKLAKQHCPVTHKLYGECFGT